MGGVPVEAVVGVACDGPVEFVDEAVVGPAGEEPVVDVGLAALGPGRVVVGFAVAGRSVAAGEAAAAVAQHHGFALFEGEGADGAAEIEGLAVGVEDHAG